MGKNRYAEVPLDEPFQVHPVLHDQGPVEPQVDGRRSQRSGVRPGPAYDRAGSPGMTSASAKATMVSTSSDTMTVATRLATNWTMVASDGVR